MRGPDGTVAFVPRTPAAVIVRQELLAVLDAAAANPLVIVRAGGGAGKTTALAQWAHGRDSAGVWVSLDRSAADRLGFWKRVTAAIVNSGHLGVRSVLNDFVVAPESAPSIVSAVSTALTLRSAPFTIVLDDFHEVTSTEVSDDLHRLAQEVSGLVIVVGTRAAGPLEAPEQRVRVDTAIVSPDHVIFGREEVGELLGLFGQDDAGADTLYRAFGGWPLPTRSAVMELAEGRASDVDAAIEQVRTYDGGLVLDGLDDDYLAFLLRASVASRISRELAEQIGGDAAPAHLDRAERDGIGTWAARESGDDFVIHAHLREQLGRELERRDPGAVAELRRVAAEDRLTHRDPLEAARQFASIGDVARLAEVVRRHYGDISYPVLAGVLRTVRPAELRHQPDLLAVLVVVDFADPAAPRRRILNMASLAVALIQARVGVGSPVERLSLLLGLVGVQRVSGQFERAAATANRLVQIAEGVDESTRQEVAGILATVWSQSAASFFFEGDNVRTVELFGLAVEWARRTDQSWRELYAVGMQSLVLAMRGEVALLTPRLARENERRRPHGWQGTYMAVGHHLATALTSLEGFDAAGAQRELDLLAPHEATIEHWPLIARIRALGALLDGQPSSGLERLNSDIASHANRPPTSRYMASLLADARAELLMASGQAERADDAVRGEGRWAVSVLTRARVQLALGRENDAIALATPIAWSEEPNPRARSEAFLVLAVAFMRLGQEEEARRVVTQGLALLDTYRLRLPLSLVPHADLVGALATAGVDPEVVLRDVPDPFAGAIPRIALTAQELQVLQSLRTTPNVADLAAHLHLSANTVKSHLKQIYRKLGVGSRAEALAVAHLRGLLPDEPPDFPEPASG